MGTVSTFDFEGANNATISGAGIALQGTGSAVYDTGDKIVGASSGKFVTTTTQVRTARCTLAASSTTMAFDILFKTDAAYPASNLTVFTPRHASGTIGSGIQWSTTGKLSYVTLSGTTLLSPNVNDSVPVNTWVRVQLRLVVGTTTTGTFDAETYLWNGTTWTQLGTTYSATAQNLGTAAVTAFDIGVNTALSGVTIRADCVRAEDGRTTAFGALPSPGGTVAEAGIPQYPNVGGTVTLTSAGSSGSGTLTYAWLFVPHDPATPLTTSSPGVPSPSITNSTSASCTVTYGVSDASSNVIAGGQYVFRVTVTGSGGSASDTVTHYVAELPGARTGVHYIDPTTLWTNEGGAASRTAALNDNSAATRAESPDSPTSAQKLRGILRPLTDGPVSLKVPSLYSGSATNMHARLLLEDGTTPLQTTTDWVLGATEALQSIDLDPTAMSLLGVDREDRRALWFEVWCTT